MAGFIPFVTAPMRLKGQLLRKFTDREYEAPAPDLIIGECESLDYADWTTDRYGQIRKGDRLLAPGRFFYRLHDVVVVRDGPAWRIVLEPGICAEDAWNSQPRGRPVHIATPEGDIEINLMRSYGPPRRERRPSLCLHHDWDTNYFHSVVETLPRAGWPREEGLLPSDAIPASLEPEPVAYDTLYYPSFWPAMSYSPEPVEWLRKHCKKGGRKVARRLLYLSRSDAKTRRVVNEAEIWNAIQAAGFEPHLMNCSTLSFDEQIVAAEEASIIIGPHGAAMTNALFSDNAAIIEFVPETYQHPCYQYLTKWSGNRYCRIVCPTGANDDLTVDVAALCRAIEWARDTADT
jgi:Glycosyltransferase 61